MYLNIASFLPAFIKTKTDWNNPDLYTIGASDISLIISAFPFAQLLLAPFQSCISGKLGSKNAIVIGFAVVTAATIGLGAIAYCKNQYVFVYLAVALRFLQGCGD